MKKLLSLFGNLQFMRLLYKDWKEKYMKKLLSLFGNSKIASKLSFGFFAIMAIFLLMALVMGLGLLNSFRSITNIADNVIPMNEDTFKLQNAVTQNKVSMLTVLSASDQFTRERPLTDVREQNLDPTFQNLRKLMKGNKDQLEALGDVESLYKQIQSANLEQVIPLLSEDKLAEATNIVVVQQEEIYNEVFEKLAVLSKKLIVETKKNTDKVTAQSKRTMIIAVVAIAVAIFVALITIVLLTRAITKPLKLVMESSEEIAAGNLYIDDINIEQKDEFGKLGEVFNRMLKQLRYLTKVAEEIAEGDLSTEVEVRSEKDVLANAFAKMSANLKSLAVIANQIAEGDLSAEVEARSEKDVLANAFAKMSANLKSLAVIANQIAKGDLTSEVKVRSQKDILATAFAKMSTSLKSLVNQINQTSDIAAQSSQVLAQATEQASQAASQLTGAVGQIAQATNDVSRTSQVAATSSQSANASAKTGQETAAKLLIKMRGIQDAVSKAQDAIESLGKQSQKIGEIVSVITKIARQTNFLSLNAAIEAARAGESGSCFAVVADEIRKLAEHSAISALEISKLITEVQEQTRRAVISTKQGTKEVQEGGAMMLEADKAFSIINAAVENISTQINLVAANTEETAAATEEMATTSENQAAAIEEVFSNAQSLAQTAQGLKQIVAAFKVN